MKECKYCGTQYADHLQSCPSCGANVVISEKEKIIEDAKKEQEITSVKKQIEEQNKPERAKIAPGKKILIAMCSIVAALAIVIIVTTILNNRPVTTDGKTNNDLAKEYEAAMESMELGKYEAAIAEFDSIPAEYKDYDKVIEQKEKAIEAYREQVLAQVDSYVAVGKHNDALSALTVAMAKYGESKELVQKKDEILYGYKQGIFAEAENYATTGDYSTAIKRLQMLLDVVGADADTEMKIQYYEKAQVLKQVQIYEDEKNYVAAIEYLEKKLDGLDDVDLATKLTGLYSAYKTICMDTAKGYIAEKKYANAVNVLEDLSKIIGNDAEVDILIYDNKKALTLEKAQAYIDTESYLAGIDYLKLQIKVLGEDLALTVKLDEMISIYKTIAFQEAEKNAKSGQYTEAVSCLNSFIYDVGVDAEVSAKILEYKKLEINIKLAEFDKSKDYAGAITYLQGVLESKTDAELKSKLEDYVSQYKKELFAKAATAYETKGYSAAVQVLSNEKLLKNDSEVKAKITYYNNKKPVLLSSLEPYQKENMKYGSTTIEDAVGNQYQEYYYGEWRENAYYIYFLDNQYERFQCKFVITIADNVVRSSTDVSIVVRDDDTNEVLYKGILDSKNVEGIKVDVDISQVKFLKIELNHSPKNYAIMVEAQLIKK